MFRLCLWITGLALVGMAIGGFLTMDPPIIDDVTSEKAREWLIIIFCIGAIGLLIFKPEKD